MQPFATHARLPILDDERLKERVLSTQPLDDWLEHIRRSYDDLDHCAPGGESLRATRDRGLAALADIASRGHRLPIAASHGNLISGVLHTIDPTFGFEDWRRLGNPDLFELTFEDRRPTAYRRLG